MPEYTLPRDHVHKARKDMKTHSTSLVIEEAVFLFVQPCFGSPSFVCVCVFIWILVFPLISEKNNIGIFYGDHIKSVDCFWWIPILIPLIHIHVTSSHLLESSPILCVYVCGHACVCLCVCVHMCFKVFSIEVIQFLSQMHSKIFYN